MINFLTQKKPLIPFWYVHSPALNIINWNTGFKNKIWVRWYLINMWLQVYLSPQEAKAERNVKQSCIWTSHTVLCSSLCLEEGRRRSILEDRQPWQKTKEQVSSCFLSSSSLPSTIHWDMIGPRQHWIDGCQSKLVHDLQLHLRRLFSDHILWGHQEK